MTILQVDAESAGKDADDYPLYELPCKLFIQTSDGTSIDGFYTMIEIDETGKITISRLKEM